MARSLSGGKKNIKKISVRTILAFLVILIICFSLVSVMVLNRSRIEKLKMEQLILEKSININDVISKLLYKTQMLSALVLQCNGEVDNLEQIADTIIDDPDILSILIAPGGVVSDVYPTEGSKSVPGLDFFSDGSGGMEAAMETEPGQFVLGGPFDTADSGQILAGRLPVFLDGPDGSGSFWGLVFVTLKYQEALEREEINEIKVQGFAYEIWRINPDNNERQIITGSGNGYDRNINYIERHIPVMNNDWYFRILPVREWYQFPETWVSVIVSICVSFLIAAVIQNNHDLKRLKYKLEKLSNTDSLTGIHNRRYFMDSVPRQMDRVKRMNSESYIIMFDLDNFKRINDKYGHKAGDMVLKEITVRVTGLLRSYDLFARYGGEEFIIFAAEIDKTSAINLVERIRLDIAGMTVDSDSANISVTASFGIAPAAPVNELEAAVDLADEALYKAKEEGRNKVVFNEDEDIFYEAQKAGI